MFESFRAISALKGIKDILKIEKLPALCNNVVLNNTLFSSCARIDDQTKFLVPSNASKMQIMTATKMKRDLPLSIIKYDRYTGKRNTVPAVLEQFYRLHWGGWIRTIQGRHKKIYKKSNNRRRILRQHVMCNAKQCTLLDKMTMPKYKKRHYFVDDIYAPYHFREEFLYTRRQPLPETINYNLKDDEF